MATRLPTEEESAKVFACMGAISEGFEESGMSRTIRLSVLASLLIHEIGTARLETSDRVDLSVAVNALIEKLIAVRDAPIEHLRDTVEAVADVVRGGRGDSAGGFSAMPAATDYKRRQ